MKYKYTVTAVRWFDKVNGTTYHSARVFNNETGEMIYCPYQYGYDSAYQQTALVAMSKAGWIPDKYTTDFNDRTKESVFMYERENNYPINWTVKDGLKRECIANGKEA
jgi:hypothetical protein